MAKWTELGKKCLEIASEDILDSIFDGVYVTDRDRRIIYWNAGAEIITGYRAGEILGTRCRDNVLQHTDEQGKELCLYECPLSKCMETGQPVRKELVFLVAKSGEKKAVEISCGPIKESPGKIIGAVEVFRDVTLEYRLAKEKDSLVEELYRLSLTDSLTLLFNRRRFDLEITGFFNRWSRLSQKFGLLLADIDHFKNINDVYGHLTGDKVLKRLAFLFQKHLREGVDLTFRYGGEEFAFIVPDVGEQELYEVAERLRSLVEKETCWNGAKGLKVTVSFGGSTPEGCRSPEEMIAVADKNLYRAKKAGRNRTVVEHR